MLDNPINFFGNGENITDDVLNRPIEEIRDNLLAIFTKLGNQTYNLSVDGFEKRPNGLMYQWGEVTLTGNDYVEFTEGYLNQCFFVTCTMIVAPNVGIPHVVVDDVDLNGFNCRTYSHLLVEEQNQITFRYLAVGY